MLEDVKKGLKEFLISGSNSEKASLLIAATDNYYKAIAHACDVFIYSRVGKLPNNHEERFRLLEALLPELYELVDTLFFTYRKSYRSVILAEDLRKVKDGLRKTLELTGLKEEFEEYLGQK